MLGAPAAERITDCGEELGLENPEDLKAQRDLGGGEGRLLGARRWEKLCFWSAALEIRTEFWGVNTLGGSCLYRRPRKRGRGACALRR